MGSQRQRREYTFYIRYSTGSKQAVICRIAALKLTVKETEEKPSKSPFAKGEIPIRS
jgi:hypothetical protein